MSWIDEMRKIPLERGVTTLDVEDGRSGTIVGVCPYPSKCVWLTHEGFMNAIKVPAASVRVDLWTDNGFGYALKWLYRRQSRWPDGPQHPGLMLLRWHKGKTTDADRLCLAKACAEVMR